MKIGKCPRCEYFQKADWSFVPFRIFGSYGISHILNRVCGFCMDSNNPDFNEFAKASGRGIGKIEAIFSPNWCRFRTDFKGVDRCSDKWVCLHGYEDSDDCPDCRH